MTFPTFPGSLITQLWAGSQEIKPSMANILIIGEFPAIINSNRMNRYTRFPGLRFISQLIVDLGTPTNFNIFDLCFSCIKMISKKGTLLHFRVESKIQKPSCYLNHDYCGMISWSKLNQIRFQQAGILSRFYF